MITLQFPRRETLRSEDLGAAAERLGASRALKPFDPATLSFAAKFSQSLLKDREAARFPQVISLAYWLRPAALERLRLEYQPIFARTDQVRVPRGLLFHLPPANVDTLFLYSWMLGVLAGNANIVRLPANLSPVAELLLVALRDCASQEIAEANAFVSYQRDDELTAVISRACDVRIVWGGDEKVSHIRTIPLPPNAIDVNFANRFSIAAVKTVAYDALDAVGRRKLAEKFYSDVFWFDQMGCASPRVVYWVGETKGADHAQSLFFKELADVAQDKGYLPDAGTAVAKLGFAYRSMIDQDVSRFQRFGSAVQVLTLTKPADVRNDVQGGGALWQVQVEALSDLASELRRSDQTLTQYGFDHEELLAFAASANGRGIDRIAPMGSALKFGHVWDGYDLIQTFTRSVSIE